MAIKGYIQIEQVANGYVLKYTNPEQSHIEDAWVAKTIAELLEKLREILEEA